MRPIDADALKAEILHRRRQAKTLTGVDMVMLIDDFPTVNGWISVKDRLPAETHSIFYRFFGTKIWRNSMWREQSDKVLVTVVFKDGTKIVTTGETHDGIWNTTISRTLEPVVSHWMPLPEPAQEA